MPAATQENRALGLATILEDNVLLIERMRGVEELGRPFEYKIQAITEKAEVKLDDLLGTAVTVRVDHFDSENGSRYFNGIICQIVQEGVGNRGYPRYELTVVPLMWFMKKKSDCRIFQNLSTVEIIDKLFSESAVTEIERRLEKTYPAREYCVQYCETDFDFVSRLMEDEGIYYFFQHSNGNHKLVLCDYMDAHKEAPGFGTVRYRREEKVVHTPEYYITIWKLRSRASSGAYAINSYNFETPLPSPVDKLLSRSIRNSAKELGESELYDNQADFLDRTRGESLAKVRREMVQADALTVGVVSNSIGLEIGCKFTLQEYPRSDQNAAHVIISAGFEVTGGGYSSGGGGDELVFNTSFTVIPVTSVYRPDRSTPIPRIKGPQTAMVCGPDGEEIYTDKHGRIKVQFLWDRYGEYDSGSSCWIRVSQASAGKEWGSMSLPRIGQEVIVDFLDGNPDRPIVTGRVYNGDSVPPYALPDNATRTVLKTNSSKGGSGFNELRFEDKKGSEQIFIHAEKNRDLRVKNDNFEYIGGEDHLIVAKDRFETVKGDLHNKVTGDVNQEAGESLSLKQGQNFNFKAGQNIAGEAGMDLHLKGGMNVVIEAGMSLTIKAGASFINLGPSGVAISGTMVLINSGGAAGSGAGCSPTPPKEAKEADKAESGKKNQAFSGGGKRPETVKSPQAVTLVAAAEEGTPFCEICARAKQNSELV